jgi:hypothetical protein
MPGRLRVHDEDTVAGLEFDDIGISGTPGAAADDSAAGDDDAFAIGIAYAQVCVTRTDVDA